MAKIEKKTKRYFDKVKNEYRCPANKVLRTTGRVHDGRTILYRASKLDCDP